MSVIGIDFGTSYTYIYGYQEEGARSNLVELPDPDPDRSYLGPYEVINGTPFYRGIPSAIGQLSDGTWIVGREVTKQWENKAYIRENCVLDMKTLLRKAVHDRVTFHSDASLNEQGDEGEQYGKIINNRYYTCIELIKQFFRVLLIERQRAGFNYKNVDKIVIGVPAFQEATEESEENYPYRRYNSILKRDIFESLLIEEDSPFSKIEEDGEVRTAVTVIPNSEPVLAAYAYLQNNIEDGDTLFVVDLGGGTSDFTLAQKKNGKLSAMMNSVGLDAPSGRTIERAFLHSVRDTSELEEIFEKKQGESEEVINEIYKEYKISLRKVKEQLFLSQGDYDIKIFAAQSNNINPDQVTSQHIEKAYQEYCKCGRRSAPLTFYDKKIRFAYNGDHKDGPSWERHDQSSSESIVYVSGNFDGEKKLFNKTIIYHLNRVVSLGLLNTKRLTVLFVGGTSNIVELRNSICKFGLNLQKEDSGTWIAKEGSVLGKGVKVKIVSPDELAEKQIADGKFLTYANAVAYGAVRAALEKNMMEDVHEVWIAFDKKNHKQLLSKSIKDNNEGSEEAKNVEPLYFKKEQLLEVKNKDGNPTRKLKLKFWILNKEDEKLSGSPFSITFDEELDGLNIKGSVYYGVLFVADQINGETIVYAVKLKERNNDTAQVFRGYTFTDYNGGKHKIPLASGNDHLEGKLANRTVFRKYIFGWSESAEGDQDGTSKRKRSACSPISEQVNGWEVTNIKKRST